MSGIKELLLHLLPTEKYIVLKTWRGGILVPTTAENEFASFYFSSFVPEGFRLRIRP